MQTDGVRRSRKCGERSIKGTKTLAYRSTGSPCAHSSLALRPITEQSNTLFSALHHRNVNKLLETLASRPCLFSWVEPWEKYNFGFRVALLVLCALCEASIAFFHVWMIRLPPCTSAFCTFCGGGQGGGGGQALSCRVTSLGTAATISNARTGFLLRWWHKILLLWTSASHDIFIKPYPNPTLYVQAVVKPHF